MTDGFGSKSYDYNQLSQLMSETRTFNGLGAFTLSYDYNLAGELKKITDATNMTINYGYDNTGRVSGITGSDSLYAGVSNYALNFQYRAWGGMKAMTDGKGYISSFLYNSKLQPSHFEISGNAVNQNYDYYYDGRINVVHNTTDQNFDRSYSYDHAGRLSEAKSGADVNGFQYGSIPYHETFGYDAFSNVTARQSDSWNGQTSNSDSASYTNNKRAGWGYDADGRNSTIDTRSYTFDAIGHQTLMTAQQVLFNGNHITVNETSGYDADGVKIYDVASGQTTRYLRSSVLGGTIVEEINSSGQKNIGYVYSPTGTELATQSGGVVIWKHNTPTGASQYTTNSSNSAIGRTELDPLGADISLDAPPDPPPSEGEGDIGAGHIGGIMDARWSDFFNTSSGCSAAGVAASCSGSMAQTNMDAEMRAFFGYRWYDLPGNANEREQGEERYTSILAGFDPEFNRLAASVTVTYSSGAVRTLRNPTLDEYQQLQTAYMADSGLVDLDTNTVTIFGGAEYFVSPQNSNQQAIDAAVGDALSILSTNNPCSQFFGGVNRQNGSRDGTEVLKALAKVLTPGNISAVDTTTGIQLSNFGTVQNVATGLEYQMPASAIVNQRGPFFGSGSFGSFSSTSRAGRALAILHEVAHLIKVATVIEWGKNGHDKKYNMYLIPEDGGNPALSRENSEVVENACRNQLKALK